MAAPRLSKSRFIAGLQCAKQLWWRVHEPRAPELVPDAALQRAYQRGTRVGVHARRYVPGGVLIDLPPQHASGRVAATQRALAAGAPVVYEASFVADGVFVSVDILERLADGFALIEVKSTLDAKEEHLPDVAIQLHVLRRSGLAVRRAELMHLNRECRHPDLSTLFVRRDLTSRLAAWLDELPARIAALRAMLDGPLPEVAPGRHCTAAYECPFLERCWPPRPPHHVSTLYRVPAATVEELEARGHATLLDLPPGFRTNRIAERQIRSVRSGRLVVERGLRRALASLRDPIAFVDFETVSPPIPVWPGCRPYQAVPVQFSCHLVGADGGIAHRAWLAEAGADPRRPFAEALLAACAPARTLAAYSAPFERRCLADLARALPDLAPALEDLAARTVDLLPMVRNDVYHPDFGGSFSLKAVLPALVPGLGYDDLVIQEGETASAQLEALLLAPEGFAPEQARRLRAALLAYCERDTFGLVRLHARLRELSA